MNNVLEKVFIPFARFAIFLIYFWFGLLKIIEVSPASPLVLSLMDRTMPFMEPASFLIYFGVFEVIVGILFLIPKLTRIACLILLVHMVTTIMPLFMLAETSWSGTLIPTLEGQYIIKNILIIALAIGIYTDRYSKKNLI